MQQVYECAEDKEVSSEEMKLPINSDKRYLLLKAQLAFRKRKRV
jgi:hypothetical protein